MAVDEQKAGVAVIIPENFTEALMGSGFQAEVEVYSDPTLTIGPDLVTNIIDQSIDNLIGINITNGVVIEQLLVSGLMIDQEQITQIKEK